MHEVLPTYHFEDNGCNLFRMSIAQLFSEIRAHKNCTKRYAKRVTSVHSSTLFTLVNSHRFSPSNFNSAHAKCDGVHERLKPNHWHPYVLYQKQELNCINHHHNMPANLSNRLIWSRLPKKQRNGEHRQNNHTILFFFLICCFITTCDWDIMAKRWPVIDFLTNTCTVTNSL